MVEDSRKESEENRNRKDTDLEELARMERLRLETLRKLNDEHSTKLKKFVSESRCLPGKSKSKTAIGEVSSEARRQSMAVEEVENDMTRDGQRALDETCNKINKLESSIASLDWELERFEIEKMKVKTERVMKRMSLSGNMMNGFQHHEYSGTL